MEPLTQSLTHPVLIGAIVGGLIAGSAQLLATRHVSRQSQREWLDDRRWRAYVGMERLAREAILTARSHRDLLRDITEGPRLLINPADILMRIVKITKWVRRMNRIERDGFDYMAQLRLVAPAEVVQHAERFVGLVAEQTLSVTGRRSSSREDDFDPQRLVEAANELTAVMRADVGDESLENDELLPRSMGQLEQLDANEPEAVAQ